MRANVAFLGAGAHPPSTHFGIKTWFKSNLKAKSADDSTCSICLKSDRVSMIRVYLVVCLHGPITASGANFGVSRICTNLAIMVITIFMAEILRASLRSTSKSMKEPYKPRSGTFVVRRLFVKVGCAVFG